MRKQGKITRRELMGSAAAVAAFTIVPRHVLARSGTAAPSDKLNLGKIGCGGMQGGGDLRDVSSENIYALCDVDERQGASAFSQYPNAKLYKDFRNLLDKEAKNLNGVVITIPDHNHALACIKAMEKGMAVYCQKPLAKYVWEANLLKKAAKKYKVITQMGNQGYSNQATRLACEIIWHGDIGDVTEVHANSGGARGAGFGRRLTEWPAVEPIPTGLKWDLWLGCSPIDRTYSQLVAPEKWRGFVDYGTGMLGDWGFHILGPANWALKLGSPTSVTATDVVGLDSINWSDRDLIKWEFPAREKMPPVTIYWHHGGSGSFPVPPDLTADDIRGYNEVFYGTKGYLGTNGRGESVSLIPRSRLTGYQAPPQVLPRSPGHFREWIDAVKAKKPSSSDFSIAGLWAEWLMMGCIALRFPGETLNWDAANLRFTNNEKANEYIKPNYRKGWEIKDIT